jgi:co-chaperonin GroES (HSP10)
MFQPLHSLVTIVMDPKDKKTPGGLVMPDNFHDVFATGVIRAVGTSPDIKAKPGDRVMIAQHTQRDQRGNQRVMPFPTILDEGVSCVICDHTEILGVVESLKN